ncbi:hypothetical protein DV737_g145, partial [Chaetothyriales sp. CBS 132003]
MARFIPPRWGQLKPLKVKGCAIQVLYSNKVAPFFREMDRLSYPNAALHAKTVDQLSNTPEDILRWNVSTDPSRKSLPRSVLRSALGRRWKQAFHEALRANGYTWHGQHRATLKRGLVGTIELAVHGGVGLNSSMWNLVGQCKQVVRAIKTQQPVESHVWRQHRSGAPPSPRQL